MAKPKKTEKKVVITKECFDAMELLAQYGMDFLEYGSLTIPKSVVGFGAADRVVSWAEGIDEIFPRDKSVIKEINDTIGVFGGFAGDPEEYVSPAK